MKFVFNRVVAAILLVSLSAVGCSNETSSASEDSGNIKVLAPLPAPGGEYKLQVFELLGISDIKTLSGKFVTFFFGPKVTGTGLTGDSPRTQFLKNSAGEYIPKNSISQQMTAIYYHIQRLAELDKEFGLEGVNHWPRAVGIAVQVQGGTTNNAFYDGPSDSMLFVPYSEKDLAIALNGGIIAHEHFHSLFYKLVKKDIDAEVHDRRAFLKAAGITDEAHDLEKGLSNFRENRYRGLSVERKNLLYKETLLRAMNEGMADFWGWMYTADPDFISKSLGQLKRRNLNSNKFVESLPRPVDILTAIDIQYDRGENQNFDGNLLALAYEFGTSYARFFKNFADVYQNSRGLEAARARKEIAKKIVQILPQFQKAFQEVPENQFYDNFNLLKLFVSTMPDLNMEECQTLAPAMDILDSSLQGHYVCKEDSDQTIKIEFALSEDAKNVEPPPARAISDDAGRGS